MTLRGALRLAGRATLLAASSGILATFGYLWVTTR
jgi:hypothetical protein